LRNHPKRWGQASFICPDPDEHAQSEGRPKTRAKALVPRNGQLFPPNYLHYGCLDYLYWHTELDP